MIFIKVMLYQTWTNYILLDVILLDVIATLHNKVQQHLGEWHLAYSSYLWTFFIVWLLRNLIVNLCIFMPWKSMLCNCYYCPLYCPIYLIVKWCFHRRANLSNFEKIGNILLKSHHSTKLPDQYLVWIP